MENGHITQPDIRVGKPEKGGCTDVEPKHLAGNKYRHENRDVYYYE